MDHGRANTDRSLSAERAKTDRFAEDERGRHHDDIDRAVRQSRAESDRHVRERRAEGDAERTADRADASLSRDEERSRSDARLEHERAEVDRVAASARERIDELKERERATIEAWITELFGRERAATDKNLSLERAAHDRAFTRSAKFIADEQLAHGHTRESLHLRDEFLLLLSQDLKQPMLAIAVAADRLRHRVKHLGADEDDRQQVEIISSMAREVLRLVGDLLERVALWREPGGDQADRDSRRQEWLEAAEAGTRVDRREGGRSNGNHGSTTVTAGRAAIGKASSRASTKSSRTASTKASTRSSTTSPARSSSKASATSSSKRSAKRSAKRPATRPTKPTARKPAKPTARKPAKRARKAKR